MTIEKLALFENNDSSLDTFSGRSNLFFSKDNTKGKTTYLRLLFYSLGYAVPSMKGIDFSKVRCEIYFKNKTQEFCAKRNNNSLELYKGDKHIRTFDLPSEHTDFLATIFDYTNISVLNNLLGFLYVDQEKGWSLLNRGTVIGRIKFSIEELLAGLNKTDISNLLERKKKLLYDKDKYTALLDLQSLSEQAYENNGESFSNELEEEYINRISLLNLKIQRIKESTKEIDNLIQKEKSFFNYIDSMQLSILDSQGVEIDVTSDKLINYSKHIDYLKARRSILVLESEKLKREKAIVEEQLFDLRNKLYANTVFDNGKDNPFNTSSLRVVDFASVDQEAVSSALDDTKAELKKVRKSIKKAVKTQNLYIDKIYNRVIEYAKKLGIEERIVHKQDYIFTTDLKSHSGAVLQKLVLCFKLAFLKVIEEEMDTKLFMAIDSPKSKEIDKKNTDLIINLLKEELKDSQLFIASIYDEYDCEKKIVFDNKAIEERKTDDNNE